MEWTLKNGDIESSDARFLLHVSGVHDVGPSFWHKCLIPASVYWTNTYVSVLWCMLQNL